MQTGLLKPQFYSFVSYVQFSYYHETQKRDYKVDDRDQLNRICEFTPNLHFTANWITVILASAFRSLRTPAKRRVIGAGIDAKDDTAVGQ